MALMPKRTKHRKIQRGTLKGIAQNNNKLDFGDFGLQALGRGWMRNNQIEAARIAINKELDRRGKVWIRIFPDKPISKKPLEVRMGKGKGNTDAWVARIRPGRVLFEVSGCSKGKAQRALRKAEAKLSIKCKLITREVRA